MTVNSIEERETITLPADPESLANAIVEQYDEADRLNILLILEKATPVPTMTDVLKDVLKNRPPPETPDPETFSPQQLEIVRRIAKFTDKSIWETPYHKKRMARSDDDGQMQLLKAAYPEWRIERFVDGEITPSKRASASRTLKRLEARDVVCCRYFNRKVSHVSLTPKGERLATRLISE